MRKKELVAIVIVAACSIPPVGGDRITDQRVSIHRAAIRPALAGTVPVAGDAGRGDPAVVARLPGDSATAAHRLFLLLLLVITGAATADVVAGESKRRRLARPHLHLSIDRTGPV